MVDRVRWEPCWLAETLGLTDCGGRLDKAHIGLAEHWLTKAPTGPHLSKEEANDERILRDCCREHHYRFDFGSLRLKREHIPPSVWEYAKEHDLTYKLDKDYPKEDDA